VADTLSESDGAWTGNPAPTFTRQWQDCDSAGNSCTNITGATGPTYAVIASDAGHTIRVVVTGTNDSGSVPATSAQTDAVASPIPSLPVGLPSVLTKTANVSAKGAGSFKLKCTGTGFCDGTFQIYATGTQASATRKVVLARGFYSVPAGKTVGVRFTLSKKAKALLKKKKHHGRLRTTLALKPTSGPAIPHPLTLKLVKPRKR
jgi:hypothetical protein